jgi:hypothetical protein
MEQIKRMGIVTGKGNGNFHPPLVFDANGFCTKFNVTKIHERTVMCEGRVQTVTTFRGTPTNLVKLFSQLS